MHKTPLALKRPTRTKNFLGNKFHANLPAWKTLVRVSMFRNGWYSNDHEELENIFQSMHDPWNFESSDYEHERFKLLLNEVIRLTPTSVLEVGCAEGLFTSMLVKHVTHVVGIDVSPTAISRATVRCPAASFITTSLELFHAPEKFDLVICAETLYYIRDVKDALERLSQLGHRCLVSYLGRESAKLGPYLEQMPGVRFSRHLIGRGLMKQTVVVAVWENQ